MFGERNRGRISYKQLTLCCVGGTLVFARTGKRRSQSFLRLLKNERKNQGVYFKCRHRTFYHAF